MGPDPLYSRSPPTTLSLVHQAEERGRTHRARIEDLARLLVEHQRLAAQTEALPEHRGLWSQLGALFGTAPLPPKSSRLGVLERQLELSQRRVLALESTRARVGAVQALLRCEHQVLLDDADALRQDARRAADAVLALEQHHQATRGSAESHLVEAEMRVREGERRSFRQAEDAAREHGRVAAEFVRLYERLHDALGRLHAAEEAALEAADRELKLHAAVAGSRDLEDRLSGLDLDTTVRRVHLAARAGEVLLAENVDRLTQEVALLAPADPRHLEAEREVLDALRPKTVAELVAAARAEVARARDPEGV